MNKIESLLALVAVVVLFLQSYWDGERILELQNRVKCLEIINTLEFIEKAEKDFRFLHEHDMEIEEKDSPLI